MGGFAAQGLAPVGSLLLQGWFAVGRFSCGRKSHQRTFCHRSFLFWLGSQYRHCIVPYHDFVKTACCCCRVSSLTLLLLVVAYNGVWSEGGGRKVNENKALAKKNRFEPYGKINSCKICKQKVCLLPLCSLMLVTLLPHITALPCHACHPGPPAACPLLPGLRV